MGFRSDNHQGVNWRANRCHAICYPVLSSSGIELIDERIQVPDRPNASTPGTPAGHRWDGDGTEVGQVSHPAPLRWFAKTARTGVLSRSDASGGIGTVPPARHAPRRLPPGVGTLLCVLFPPRRTGLPRQPRRSPFRLPNGLLAPKGFRYRWDPVPSGTWRHYDHGPDTAAP